MEMTVISVRLLPGTGKGWREGGVLYEQKEQHKFKLLLVHGREPSNLADKKMKPRDGKQFLPKVTQKPPAPWLLGPILFAGLVTPQPANSQGCRAGGRAIENSKEAAVA